MAFFQLSLPALFLTKIRPIFNLQPSPTTMKLYSILGIFLLASVFSSAQTQSCCSEKIDPVLLKHFQSNTFSDFFIILKEQADLSPSYSFYTKEEKGEYVYQVLSTTAARSQAPVIALLQQKGINFQSYWVVNSIYVKNGDLDLITQLAERSDVRELIENANYRYHPDVKESAAQDKTMAVEWGITKTQADAVWALGFRGQGVVVGGQDTGYEWDHPAIKSQYRGNNNGTIDHNYNWHDAIHSSSSNPCGNDANAPCDDDEHGTHTMGTMLGDDGGSNKIGMAPGAKWIGCRNMNAGLGSLASYIECFQWFIAPTNLSNASPNPAKAPHVINNSWGCDGSEGCNSSNYATMETVVNNVKAAGIVVVVSAGNDGSACSTITTPAAIFASSFTVGSTTSSDGISGFSSRGPVTVYGNSMMGPDVSAPGSGIRSCVPGGAYKSMSGTSMAGPHVVGLVALVISANPALAGNVNMIENIIKNTAVQLTSTQTCGNVSGSAIPNNTFGYGRINALAAVQNALNNAVVGYQALQAGVSTYPNPCNNKLSIELSDWNDMPCTLELYNISGQHILSENWVPLFKSKHELDVSGLPDGVYFYKLSNTKQQAQGRLVKIKS